MSHSFLLGKHSLTCQLTYRLQCEFKFQIIDRTLPRHNSEPNPRRQSERTNDFIESKIQTNRHAQFRAKFGAPRPSNILFSSSNDGFFFASLLLFTAALEIIGLHPSETPEISQRNLVFVGVMTAKDFLQSRAKAVYDTWGKSIPGRIAFFSSEESVADGKS